MVSEYSLKNTAATKLLMPMSAKLEKSAVILTITVILLFFVLGNINIVFSSNGSGKLDLFTQKESYSGKGLNVSSDAFGPGENVFIYAVVTYNDYPIPNIPVAFEVHGPSNIVENITYYRTAFTNATGIAIISFIIPYDNDTAFGVWTAIANADIGGIIVHDSLSFKAGWIVEIVSIKTLNENNVEQEKFAITQNVIIELGLKTIAMTEKTATLTITTYDALNRSINAAEKDNVVIPPNETLTYAYFPFYIPKNTLLGYATIFANAYTTSVSQGGVPYCPEVSKKILIVKHDVAITNVEVSPKIAYKGDIINIDITVNNKGSELETLYITVYANETIISQITIVELQPFSQRILKLTWNTSSVSEGLYQISAYAMPVPDEIDVSDNGFIDDFVKIEPRPQHFHDITIVNVSTPVNTLYLGELLQINVDVVNKGTETETFNVSTFFDSSLIKTMQIESLTPNTETTLIFFWNTSHQSEGYYQISASAPLTNDINPADNTYIDGIVHLKASPAGLLIHDIAILNVIPSQTLAYIGDIVNITIIVKNLGNYTESFNITLFHDSGTIGKLIVENLNPRAKRTLIFQWNTTNMTEGNYLLKAQTSSISGETNIENNFFIDGIVELVAPSRWFVPEWFYWLLYSLLILIPILLLIMLYRRRRKKAENAFSSGWTAWYYCYNLRNKTSTTNKQQTTRRIPKR